MVDIKTKQNDANVSAFLDGLADEKRRQDSYVVLEEIIARSLQK